MINETGSRDKNGQAKHRRARLNGYTVFAGAIMFVLGLWQVLAGITAVARNSLFATQPGYIYAFDIAVWGWILILLGVLMAGVSTAVLRSRNGGDTAAIWLACLCMVANFVVIPYYPIWSLTIIGLSGTLLWALMAPDRAQA